MCFFLQTKASLEQTQNGWSQRCTSENPFLHTIICLNERRNDNLGRYNIFSHHLFCMHQYPPPPSTAFFNRPKKGDDGTTYTLEIWADSCPVSYHKGLVRLPFVNIIILPMYSLMLCLFALFHGPPTHNSLQEYMVFYFGTNCFVNYGWVNCKP